jgi:hypothetical protein
MSEASPANFELAIVLPLGVIANQLMKLEADLRFLSAKTSRYASEPPDSVLAAQAAARIEKINEALEAIRTLISDIATDTQPRSAKVKFPKMRTDRED